MDYGDYDESPECLLKTELPFDYKLTYKFRVLYSLICVYIILNVCFIVVMTI